MNADNGQIGMRPFRYRKFRQPCVQHQQQRQQHAADVEKVSRQWHAYSSHLSRLLMEEAWLVSDRAKMLMASRQGQAMARRNRLTGLDLYQPVADRFACCSAHAPAFAQVQTRSSLVGRSDDAFANKKPAFERIADEPYLVCYL
ncbi:MAG TPA: hypothetical protein VFQ87_07605 [Bradyrhizobium sp.]|jgi:hypothetical protein|nr:hypothetical protein [Bradyrhizobium sp.]